MTDALRKMVEAMSAELQRQAAEGSGWIGEGAPNPRSFELDGHFDLEMVAHAALGSVGELPLREALVEVRRIFEEFTPHMISTTGKHIPLACAAKMYAAAGVGLGIAPPQTDSEGAQNPPQSA